MKKVVYIAIKDTSKKRAMPTQNWRQAMSRFIFEFEERPEKHINKNNTYTELVTLFAKVTQ
jgi:hypothetical protein